jgi:hypothetical protein
MPLFLRLSAMQKIRLDLQLQRSQISIAAHLFLLFSFLGVSRHEHRVLGFDQS